MHLLIPFAAPPAAPGGGGPGTGAAPAAAASPGFPLPPLPQLAAILSGAETVHRDDGDALGFTPPHERALARALGLAGADGCLPWAAWHAAADGIETGDLAWGELLPAHWHVGTDQVSFTDPSALVLSEADARVFFEAVRPLFTSEGFDCVYGAPLRWYVAHESLAALRTASPDRVIGRNVDRWLEAQPAARLVRRLQNELQMLLYTHPLNAEREAAGRPTVNSVWLWGCGPAQRVTGAAPVVDDRLRAPALAGDWAAWCRAWETLDAGPLADWRTAAARDPAGCTLTLCGERAAVTLALPSGGAWARWCARLASLGRRSDPAAWLAAL